MRLQVMTGQASTTFQSVYQPQKLGWISLQSIYLPGLSFVLRRYTWYSRICDHAFQKRFGLEFCARSGARRQLESGTKTMCASSFNRSCARDRDQVGFNGILCKSTHEIQRTSAFFSLLLRQGGDWTGSIEEQLFSYLSGQNCIYVDAADSQYVSSCTENSTGISDGRKLLTDKIY